VEKIRVFQPGHGNEELIGQVLSIYHSVSIGERPSLHKGLDGANTPGFNGLSGDCHW
jgi:hypothetical protein